MIQSAQLFGHYPFIKAIVVYALTGIAVYIGKWIIAKIKQLMPLK